MIMDKIFVLLTIFFLGFTNITVVNALDQQSQPQSKVMKTYNKDINGDHVSEKIQIIKVGQTIKVKILNNKLKQTIFSLGKAKKTRVIFQDLTQDHVKDIFITHSGNDNKPQYLLLAYSKDQMNRILLPETLDVIAKFENNYKASIKINQSTQAFTLNLQNHKDKLDRNGLYHNGALNEPTELMVSTIDSFKLTRLKDLTFGLKGRQLVNEGFGGAKLAYIDSNWKWVNGEWALQKSSVKLFK